MSLLGRPIRSSAWPMVLTAIVAKSAVKVARMANDFREIRAARATPG